MKFSTIESTRTNNFTDLDMELKIKTLWRKNNIEIQRMLKEGVTIASIYHNYQSDYKGDYTMSLGFQDETNGLFDTSNQQWKKYVVDVKNELGIFNTWKEIWLDEDNHKINRTYNFDFEEYKPNGEVSIQVGIY